MSVTVMTWPFACFEDTLDTGFELGIERRCYVLGDGDRMVIGARASIAFTHTDPVQTRPGGQSSHIKCRRTSSYSCLFHDVS